MLPREHLSENTATNALANSSLWRYFLTVPKRRHVTAREKCQRKEEAPSAYRDWSRKMQRLPSRCRPWLGLLESRKDPFVSCSFGSAPLHRSANDPWSQKASSADPKSQSNFLIFVQWSIQPANVAAVTTICYPCGRAIWLCVVGWEKAALWVAS